MLILHDFRLRGNLRSLHGVRGHALTPLLHGVSDPRRAIAVMAVRALAAVSAFGQMQGALLAQNIMGRARQGADFAARFTPADTMVAAGGR